MNQNQNENQLSPQQLYLNRVTEYVDTLVQLYVTKYNVFDPLTKILPNYWDDIFLRAVRNVMFAKHPFVDNGKTKNVWTIKTVNLTSDEIAKQIIEEHRMLKITIWRKRGWGDPYRKKMMKKLWRKDSYCESFEQFKKSCEAEMMEYIEDKEKRDAVIYAIYIYGIDNHREGYEIGLVDGELITRATLTTIHDNVELNLKVLESLIHK